MLNIRAERLKRDWTQENVAELIGITTQAVSLIENGKRYPSYEILRKLESIYNLPYYYLLEEEELS